MGATTAKGYGKIMRDGRTLGLHREVLSLTQGPGPGLLALHSCDTPSCVNPEHLRWGTASENTRDMHTRGRWRWAPKYRKR